MHRLSGVIEVIDGYDERPLVGAAPRFRLNGTPIAPLRRPDARFVLMNLAPGRYRLDVDAPSFLPCLVEFEVKPQATLDDVWLRCVLAPGPTYAYPARTTLIRGVLDAASPAAEIDVRYDTARGQTRHVRTRCTPGGTYVLALPGRLADPTAAILRFAFADGGARELPVTVTPGRMHRAGMPS